MINKLVLNEFPAGLSIMYSDLSKSKELLFFSVADGYRPELKFIFENLIESLNDKIGDQFEVGYQEGYNAAQEEISDVEIEYNNGYEDGYTDCKNGNSRMY
jgi:flagellar biosynthesis/type III secretory pathway protein FliH